MNDVLRKKYGFFFLSAEKYINIFSISVYLLVGIQNMLTFNFFFLKTNLVSHTENIL